MGDQILGSYFLRANQAGGGAHICNAGYATADGAKGKGVGRAMCEHSIMVARERGFHGMQFNFVVSTNDRAMRLWRSCGFDIVGTIPHAFRHPEKGLVDAFVMYQSL
jgi:ribosomal protein S18 acetylase RimI-like enzyme